MLKKGGKESVLISELQKEGIDEDYARVIISNVQSDQQDKKDFWKLIFIGATLIFAGSLINYFSYLIAQKYNATFFWLFWGIIVSGVLSFIRAHFLFRKGLFKN